MRDVEGDKQDHVLYNFALTPSLIGVKVFFYSESDYMGA